MRTGDDGLGAGDSSHVDADRGMHETATESGRTSNQNAETMDRCG